MLKSEPHRSLGITEVSLGSRQRKLGQLGHGASAEDEQQFILVEVTNRFGLPLTLGNESFSSSASSKAELPRKIDGVSEIRISGMEPVGWVVYECRLAYRSSAPREMVFHTTDGKSEDDSANPKKVAVHGVDKRGTQGDRFVSGFVFRKVPPTVYGTAWPVCGGSLVQP